MFHLRQSSRRRLIFKTSEGLFLFFSVIVTLLMGFFLFLLSFFNTSLALMMTSAFWIHILGGRLASIIVCLEWGMSSFWTIVYNMVLETVIVFFTYPLFVFIMRDLIRVRVFHVAIKNMETSTQKYRSRFQKYELIGLFLFVIFPLQMTGPVFGSMLGYLMDLRMRTNLTIVMLATFLSIFVYVIMGKEMLLRIKDLSFVSPWVVGFILVILVLLHIRSIQKWKKINQ